MWRGKIRFILLGVVLLGCMAFQIFAWMGIPLLPEDSDSSPPRPRRKRPPVFQGAWQDESQYIITTISSDIAEMMYFAAQHKGLGPDFLVKVSRAKGRYQLRANLGSLGQVQCALVLDRAIWDPSLYQPWCQALAQQLKPFPPQHPVHDSDALIQKLTDPRPQVLASVDAQLSKSGLDQMGNPEWHDQAALLLGAQALREAPGLFFQIRHELCRLTSHLAMANFLRGSASPSVCHQLAQATMICLYGKENQTDMILQKVSDVGPPGAWKRAIQMRLTGDYRIGRGVSRPTLLEERERFQADYSTRSCGLAWKSRPSLPEWQDLADWTRLANTTRINHNDTPGVNIGHQLLERGVLSELKEMSQVWAGEGWGLLQPAQREAFLNARPQRCVTGPSAKPQLQVLGRGLWGAFLQRHLCHTIYSDYQFLDSQLAVPQAAAQYRQQADKLASKLRLYPFAIRQMVESEQEYRPNQEACIRVIRSHPEVVPAGVWNWLCYETDFGDPYIPGGGCINEWHFENPLPGTTYDLNPRMNHPSFINRSDLLDQVKRMQTESPHNAVLYAHLLRLLKEKGEQLSKQDLLKILGPMVDYNSDAVFRVATEAPLTYAERAQWMERAAHLNPRYYFHIINTYHELGDPKRFESAFVSWMEADPDSVELANQSHEMIELWERTGRKSQATALADLAAESYSCRGLWAKADLLESRGQVEEALALYQRAAERYEVTGPVLGCLKRAADKNPRYQSRLRDRVARLPGGLKPYRQPVDGAPPQLGLVANVAVDGSLEKGDIIVAVRGYSVESSDQYLEIRDMEVFQPFDIVIYSHGKYRKSGPYPPRHRFGNLTNYRG